MAKPQNTKPGCFSFSSFLRVFLCAGNGTTPPVHPYHITESEESENAHFTKEKMVVNDNDDIACAPGVVARLMGLDSLPNPKWVVKCGTPDSVPRSRSVNFVDYLLEFDASHVNSHRRVKTSASFREVPSLVQNQKGNGYGNGNNLFVFCMDADNNMREEQEGRNEMREVEKLRQRKRQKESVSVSVSVKNERNQGKKNKKISKLKNEPRRVPSSSKNGSRGRNHHGEVRDFSSVSSNPSKCSSSCSSRHNGASSRTRFNTSLPNKHKKGVVEPNIRNRNQQSVLKEESECSLENHSPVSVVESNDYLFLYGADFLGMFSQLNPFLLLFLFVSNILFW